MYPCKTLVFFSFLLACGCSSNATRPTTADDALVDIFPRSGTVSGPKTIYVFLDGTANDGTSGTNVWRSYQAVSKHSDAHATGIYIAGVGTADDPFNSRKLGTVEALIELGLGKNMQARILSGYEFIAKQYGQGDKIAILGFSRGAHQARALAGLLAYAGVPKLSDQERTQAQTDTTYLPKVLNDILELTKKRSDAEYNDRWVTWSPNDPPMLAGEIKEARIAGKKGRAVQSVPIAFVGVWDTVPGSSLKRYGECMEKKGFVKNKLAPFIPGVDKGDRYKTGSYPAIGEIAHAVALDEKRSKFAPLFVCAQLHAKYPKIHERWFPGAHADVGGGYTDEGADDLPSISLDWMLSLLERSMGTPLRETTIDVEQKAKGLAHWSIGDAPANLLSECKDRTPAADASIDDSAAARRSAGRVPIRVAQADGKQTVVARLSYPSACDDEPLPQ